MNKQTIINRLEALDLSQYPYFEIKELIRDLGKVGFIIFTLHPGKTITRARCDGNLKTGQRICHINPNNIINSAKELVHLCKPCFMDVLFQKNKTL